MTQGKGSGLEQLFGFYDKRGYQHRVGTGKRPAIVVIDFSNAFTANEGDFPGGDFSKEMAATLRMLNAARAKRIPIFYTTIAYAEPQIEAGLWGKKVPWLYHCKKVALRWRSIPGCKRGRTSRSSSSGFRRRCMIRICSGA